MANKKNQVKKVKKVKIVDHPKQINFNSPSVKHKLKLNKKSHDKRGINAIIAITAEAGPKPLTASQTNFIAAHGPNAPEPFHPFEDLAVNYRHQLRQKGGETSLSQYQWEALTKDSIVQSVAVSNPSAIVGPLLAKATNFERKEFYAKVVKQDLAFAKEAKALRLAIKKA